MKTIWNKQFFIFIFILFFIASLATGALRLLSTITSLSASLNESAVVGVENWSSGLLCLQHWASCIQPVVADADPWR